MKILDPQNKTTVMISPKEMKIKLGLDIDGEITSIFMRKGHGKNKNEQERIEIKVSNNEL